MRIMNVWGQQNLSIACSPISQVQIMTEPPASSSYAGRRENHTSLLGGSPHQLLLGDSPCHFSVVASAGPSPTLFTAVRTPLFFGQGCSTPGTLVPQVQGSAAAFSNYLWYELS